MVKPERQSTSSQLNDKEVSERTNNEEKKKREKGKKKGQEKTKKTKIRSSNLLSENLPMFAIFARDLQQIELNKWKKRKEETTKQQSNQTHLLQPTK
jgi:hypothetical protein